MAFAALFAKLLSSPRLWLCLVLFFAGGWLGKTVADHRYQTERLAMQQAAIAHAQRITAISQELAIKHEEATTATRRAEEINQMETTKNVVQNPHYRRCGLDADGLRLWNQRNAGAEPAASQSAGRLRNLADRLGWHAAQPDQQSQPVDSSLSRLPEAARRAGELDQAAGAHQ